MRRTTSRRPWGQHQHMNPAAGNGIKRDKSPVVIRCVQVPPHQARRPPRATLLGSHFAPNPPRPGTPRHARPRPATHSCSCCLGECRKLLWTLMVSGAGWERRARPGQARRGEARCAAVSLQGDSLMLDGTLGRNCTCTTIPTGTRGCTSRSRQL